MDQPNSNKSELPVTIKAMILDPKPSKRNVLISKYLEGLLCASDLGYSLSYSLNDKVTINYCDSEFEDMIAIRSVKLLKSLADSNEHLDLKNILCYQWS